MKENVALVVFSGAGVSLAFVDTILSIFVLSLNAAYVIYKWRIKYIHNKNLKQNGKTDKPRSS